MTAGPGSVFLISEKMKKQKKGETFEFRFSMDRIF